MGIQDLGPAKCKVRREKKTKNQNKQKIRRSLFGLTLTCTKPASEPGVEPRLWRAASGGEMGREPPKETPASPGLLSASVQRSPYRPARNGLVVSDKLNITVYYQAYPPIK